MRPVWEERSKESAIEDGAEEGRSIQPAWMEDGKHGMDGPIPRQRTSTTNYYLLTYHGLAVFLYLLSP